MTGDDLKRYLPVITELITELPVKKTADELGGPCPKCGGDDRFSVWPSKGNFYCRQCEWKGDAITFLQWRDSKTFTDLVKEYAPDEYKSDTGRKKKQQPGKSKSIFAWTVAEKTHEKISQYFATRNIGFSETFPASPSIRFSEFTDKDTDEQVYSILSAVTKPTDKTVGATHRTFISADCEKKSRIMKGDCKGRGVWFRRKGGNTLFVGEGIETVLSVMQARAGEGDNDSLFCAGLTTSGLKGLELPDGIEKLYILVDSDENFAGQKAAFKLAKKFGTGAMLITPDPTCFTDNPAKKDFNDITTETINHCIGNAVTLADIKWKPPKKLENEAADSGGQPVDEFPASTVKMLEEINVHHAAVLIGGKFRIIKENIDKKTGRLDVSFMEQSSFSLFYRNRKCWVPYGEGMIPSNIGKVWLEWSQRRTYSDVVFSPGNNVSKDEFNLFRGFAVAPKKGNWQLMQDHIFSVICDGDMEIYKYVIAWMADTVQNPGGDRPGVALVLTGGRGTGKGIFANSFGKIFGGAFIPISSADGFTGQFNMHLSKCMVAFLDEAVWGGDKKSEGRLKAMITEPTMLFQPKGIDSIALGNYMRVIMASNEDWVVPAGEDERRFCVLKTRSDKQKDFKYFRAIDGQMKDGGVEAMMYDLLRVDYSGVELRDAPLTAGLAEQVEESLDVPLSFWKEVLSRGYIFTNKDDGTPQPSKSDGEDGNLWPESAWKHEVYHEFISIFCKYKAHSPKERSFWRHTYKWYDFRKTVSHPLNGDNRQSACVHLLGINEMRTIFNSFAGKTEWED